jgi:carbon-monoxide dehydrogenase medium subunit
MFTFGRINKSFRYLEPGSIEEACQLMSKYMGKARVLAGGTDLLIQMKRDAVDCKYLLNIKRIPNLDLIVYRDGILRIGALVTHAEVIDSPIIKRHFEILREACSAVGSVQIRNLGTLVGNICNASPSADSVPPLITLGAQVKIVSSMRERKVPLEDFFSGPFRTVLEPDEIVAEVEIPPLSSNEHSLCGGCYRWVPKVTTTDETLVGVAAFVEVDPDRESVSQVRIALGSVAPTVIRAREAEKSLTGKEIAVRTFQDCGRIVTNEIAPRSRSEYRVHLAEILTEKSLYLATERALARKASAR